MEKPVIEVIIPTYRPDSQVIELVRRLKKQTGTSGQDSYDRYQKREFPGGVRGRSGALS